MFHFRESRTPRLYQRSNKTRGSFDTFLVLQILCTCVFRQRFRNGQIIHEKRSFPMCFAYEMGLSSGHRSGRLLSSFYFPIIACHAISPKCRTVFWCYSALQPSPVHACVA